MLLLRWFMMSVGVGIASGAASSALLYALHFFGQWRDSNGWIIWLLPLCGLAIGWIYHHYARDCARGTSLIFDEIESAQGQIPLKMAPLIFVTTVMTHLFGGSAGREGTVVQISAVFSDQWRRVFNLTDLDKKILLMAGMGAGFGSAIGAPLAGMIFGIEVVRKTQMWWRALLPSAIASAVAYSLTLLLMAPHTVFPEVYVPPIDLLLMGVIVFMSLIFGTVARFYIFIARRLKKEFAILKYPPLRPLVGGLAIVLLYYWEGSYSYIGLGLDRIQNAMITPSLLIAPFEKIVFTAITLSSGFKGGEFIPLVFVGTTLGSAVGFLFPSYFSLTASLGFSSVFAAASKTPLACALMAIELFGIEVAPFVVVSCYIASFVSGSKTIYHQ